MSTHCVAGSLICLYEFQTGEKGKGYYAGTCVYCNLLSQYSLVCKSVFFGV